MPSPPDARDSDLIGFKARFEASRLPADLMPLLLFPGGYGGMVSLAQMTVAGLAGYVVAIYGTSSMASISLGWPWWLAVPFALFWATVFAAAVGWLSVRTEGIYTIMITLAIGVAFFYLAQQNYTVFNGFGGQEYLKSHSSQIIARIIVPG